MFISKKKLKKLLEEEFNKGFKKGTESIVIHTPFTQIKEIKTIPGVGIFNDNGLNTITSYVPPSCVGCPKHPSNGGDGICHCTLGGLEVKY